MASAAMQAAVQSTRPRASANVAIYPARQASSAPMAPMNRTARRPASGTIALEAMFFHAAIERRASQPHVTGRVADVVMMLAQGFLDKGFLGADEVEIRRGCGR